MNFKQIDKCDEQNKKIYILEITINYELYVIQPVSLLHPLICSILQENGVFVHL